MFMNPQRFRYWVARLRPIAKPQVWLPVMGATMIGGFGWVAYQNPENLSFIGGGQSPSDQEGSAIGADIDSVSVLMQEMGDASGTNVPNPNGAKPKAAVLKPGSPAQSDTLISDTLISGDRSRPSTGASLSQLALFTSGNVPPSGGAQNNLANLAQNALFVRSETATARTNPLTQAIDRLTGQTRYSQTSNTTPIEGSGFIETRPMWNGVPADGTAGLNSPTPPIVTGGSQPIGTGYGNSGGNSGYGNSGYGNNAYTNLTGASAGYAVPDSGVATPVAPVVPIAPNPSYNANVNSGVVTPLPYPGAGAPDQSSTYPVEQVFTAPRIIPGRPIGAGNINTFSNP
jgi:hypothetical protein